MGHKKIKGDQVEGSYGTWSELQYIEGLPNHINRKTQKYSQLQLLKKYLANAERRTYWGQINKGAVIGKVLDEIASLERKGVNRGRV